MDQYIKDNYHHLAKPFFYGILLKTKSETDNPTTYTVHTHSGLSSGEVPNGWKEWISSSIDNKHITGGIALIYSITPYDSYVIVCDDYHMFVSPKPKTFINGKNKKADLNMMLKQKLQEQEHKKEFIAKLQKPTKVLVAPTAVFNWTTNQ